MIPHWERLCAAVRGKYRLYLVATGMSADLLQIEDGAAVLTVNDAFVIDQDIHVTVDVGSVRPAWVKMPAHRKPLWVYRHRALQPGDEYPVEITCNPQTFIQTEDLWPGVRNMGGSGATALWLAWELARMEKLELITAGLDLGIFYPPQAGVRYASRFPDALVNGNFGKPDPARRPAQFIPGRFKAQITSIGRLAIKHAQSPDRPAVRNLSAVDWTKIDPFRRTQEQAVDQEIVNKVFRLLTENDGG